MFAQQHRRKKISRSARLGVSLRLFAVVALGIGVLPARAADPVLKVLVASQIAPKMYMGADGKPTGYMTELGAAIVRKAGYTPVIEAVPWARAIDMAGHGEGVIPGFSKNPERDKVFNYSDAMCEDRVQFVTLKKSNLVVNSMADLKGKTVGVQRGSSYGKQYEEDLALVTADMDNSADARLKKLISGHIEAAVIAGGNEAVKYNAGLAGIDLEKLTVQAKPLTIDSNYFGVAKSRPDQAEILKRLNAAIAAMKADGSLDKTTAAWK